MQTTSRVMTIDDLPAEEVGTRHELIDGGLLVTPDPTVNHQVIVSQVIGGLVAQEPSAFVLPGANVIVGEATLLIPDVVVITEAAARRGELGVAPADLLLVVEVESPATRRRDRTLKRELYAEWNVPYWLVDPVARTVTEYGQTPFTSDGMALFLD